jgi:hypothetical protein
MLVASVAIAVATFGGIVAKNFNASGAQVQSIVRPAAGTVLRQDNPAVQGIVRPAAGTVLRQDNPAVQGSQAISALVGGHTGRSSGIQFETAGLAADDQTDSDLTRVLPTEKQGNNPEPDMSDRPGFRA